MHAFLLDVIADNILKFALLIESGGRMDRMDPQFVDELWHFVEVA